MDAKKPPLFEKTMTLLEAYTKMTAQSLFAPKTPFMIRLMENPASPLGYPGSIDLTKHDYMHCILNQPLTVKGEAYVLGFTMGADPRFRKWHAPLFKFIAQYLYPRQYKFKEKHIEIFDHALALGLQSNIKDFENLNWSDYMGVKLSDLRALIGVEELIAQA
ncbi:MAG TPA: hypothetical protein VIN59_09245 [Alphaproteobacteria bacterium]